MKKFFLFCVCVRVPNAKGTNIRMLTSKRNEAENGKNAWKVGANFSIQTHQTRMLGTNRKNARNRIISYSFLFKLQYHLSLFRQSGPSFTIHFGPNKRNVSVKVDSECSENSTYTNIILCIYRNAILLPGSVIINKNTRIAFTNSTERGKPRYMALQCLQINEALYRDAHHFALSSSLFLHRNRKFPSV